MEKLKAKLIVVRILKQLFFFFILKAQFQVKGHGGLFCTQVEWKNSGKWHHYDIVYVNFI